MRILTVRQPYAWAIIHGGKDVENRVRNVAGGYRGPVAIHAGRSWADDRDGAKALCDRLTPESTWDMPLHRGAIIGVVDLVDVHLAEDCYRASRERAINLYGTDRDTYHALPNLNPGAGGLIEKFGMCSEWAEEEAFHLVLANPRAVEPIPYTGTLGLRTITDIEVLKKLEVES